MIEELIPLDGLGNKTDDDLFLHIASELETKGFSINVNALPVDLCLKLREQLSTMSEEQFDTAGIGRENQLQINNFVRSGKICWITGESTAGKDWLQWTEKLQVFLNRRLFLGLFSFESHFAHYKVGDFYKRHYDAFKGETNRIVSVVVYLNPEWTPADKGELVLYVNNDDRVGIKVRPTFGTVVVFLSEDFPHEVLPAGRDRYSIAGWYRVNATTAERVDTPL